MFYIIFYVKSLLRVTSTIKQHIYIYIYIYIYIQFHIVSLCVNKVLFLGYFADSIAIQCADYIHVSALVNRKHGTCRYSYIQVSWISQHVIFVSSMTLKREVVPLRIAFVSLCLLMYGMDIEYHLSWTRLRSLSTSLFVGGTEDWPVARPTKHGHIETIRLTGACGTQRWCETLNRINQIEIFKTCLNST
jgi:hypothetical protein